MKQIAIETTDGIKLATQTVGSGSVIVFVHEFAGDMHSWEPQIQHFARKYQCVTFSARGYFPSDIPEDSSCYSQERARDDILDVMDALKIEKAHVVGLSMGGFAAFHFAITYPDRISSLTLAGCGYGAEPEVREQFQKDALALADTLESQGMDKIAPRYARGATRVQFEKKDPIGFHIFEKELSKHSTLGSALTMRCVQATRPSLWDFAEQMNQFPHPTLIINGDEDEGCLAPGLFMKHNISGAGMVTLPMTGHTINLEEPVLFNSFLTDFLHQVELGRWPSQDVKARLSQSGLGDFSK